VALYMLAISAGIQFLAMKTNKTLLGFYTALALVWSTSALAQTPANDNFANRTVLSGSSISFGGSLAGATLETNEPTTYPGSTYWTNGASGSLWWSWTAPVSTAVNIWFPPPQSGINRLAVYTGTDPSALTVVDYLVAPAGRYLAFSVTAGTEYQIQVVGADLQPFSVQLTATNPPVFVFQPQDCTVSPYGSAIFSAMASATNNGPFTTYQWYFNGVPLPGQIFPSLLIHGVTTNQAGIYSVTASNIGGVMPGGSATLTVTDTNPVPRLAVLPPGTSKLQFNLTGEPGRWYKIESSTDLQNWTNASWLQLTNPTTLVSIPRLAPIHFVRASLDAPTDVCVAQLKQMRWAGMIWLIETKELVSATVPLSFLVPYLPTNSQTGAIPFCPENGIYSAEWAVTNRPTCSLKGHGHAIADPQ
jgi:hypothetical protein